MWQFLGCFSIVVGWIDFVGSKLWTPTEVSHSTCRQAAQTSRRCLSCSGKVGTYFSATATTTTTMTFNWRLLVRRIWTTSSLSLCRLIYIIKVPLVCVFASSPSLSEIKHTSPQRESSPKSRRPPLQWAAPKSIGFDRLNSKAELINWIAGDARWLTRCARQLRSATHRIVWNLCACN